MTNSPVRVWCVDSSGFGGAELSLLRVIKMNLGSNTDIVLCPPHASPILIRRLQQGRILFSTAYSADSNIRSLVKGLATAIWSIIRFPRSLFIVWCHRLDSNRWLQLTLALLGRRFIVVERLLPTDTLSLRHSRITLPIKRIVSRRARFVVVNGRSLIDHYRQLLNCEAPRLVAIPNSRPIAELRQRVTQLRRCKNQLRTNLEIPLNAKVLVCVGRLTEQKGQAILLEALASCIAQNQPFYLLFVGEGNDRPKLERDAQAIAPDKVKFIGYCDDVVPFLALSDIFVLPSLAEGLPGALIEAMAAGLPCIASDIPGNRELVLNGQTGLTFRGGDAVALAEAILRLLSDGDLARSCGEAAWRWALEGYDQRQEEAAWRRMFFQLQCGQPVN